MTKYLCIHGHFYQPPRENPWIEEIEQQESAAPYHDWNERILKECYEPNCYARIVDGNNRITDIDNNYSLISFNFGPTLLSWLEKKAPDVYAHILEADRESLKRLGHGNAIAQAYNHMILPLAHERDKETQILWGIEDFRSRFNREPEAMWLPETAVNDATVAALIKQGIKFIILSPTQAQRVRKLSGGTWVSVADGTIDTTAAFRCFLKDKNGAKIADQHLDVFFFNMAISGEISFGNLLSDGNRLADRLIQGCNPEIKRPQLVHAATDGETYGHHKKFGEMALAYALRAATTKHGFTLTNYGAFLEQFPPEFEVELKNGANNEGTSWSCSHGVGRWKEDCGCKVQWESAWNQKWRKPLREALNLLRDQLAELFEQSGAAFFNDPWAARNDYIAVILDKSHDNIERFFMRSAKRVLASDEKVAALKLLEIQRHAQLMFTSCGWFFDEITGIEATQILKFADRALHLAEIFSGKELAAPFVDKLSQARSNIPGCGTGKDIYYRVIKPARVSVQKVLNQYIIATAVNGEQQNIRPFYTYQIETTGFEKKESDKAFLITGRIKTASVITTETQNFFFALAYLGSYYFRCAVTSVMPAIDYSPVKNELVSAFAENPHGIFQTMEKLFEGQCYSLHDVLQEEKQRILRMIINKQLAVYEEGIGRAFDENRETIEAAMREGMIIPPAFKIAAEHTLSSRLTEEIETHGDQPEVIEKRGVAKEILEQAQEFGYSLDVDRAAQLLCAILRNKIEGLLQVLSASAIEQIHNYINFMHRINLPSNETQSQNIFYGILKDYFSQNSERISAGDEATRAKAQSLINLAQQLNFNTERFAALLG
jgi:alpha-amylase/alpha-mannosidase (GH57 family)